MTYKPPAPRIRRGLPVPNNKAAKLAKAWHWGVPATQVIEWKERDIPDHELIEIGRLVELHVQPVRLRRGYKQGDSVDLMTAGAKGIARLSKAHQKVSHAVFDPRTPNQRILLLTPPEVRARSIQQFDPGQTVSLPALARTIGGRQADDGGFPNVRVTPLGAVTNIVYQTKKNGDDVKIINAKVYGPGSQYIHEFSEEDHGPYPFLAVDALGRLWLAGGSYWCAIEGITN
jgi:hypothetical protein